MAKYQIVPYGPTCLTQADTPWRISFFFGSILIFFIVPCFILMILYSLISKNLMKPAPGLVQTSSGSLKYRKKVILMLGTVVISFFVLLLPFRVLTLVILFVPNDIFLEWYENNYNLFLSIMYASRILIHINSAINPILYNLMSSKFRNGFYKLFFVNNRLCCELLFCTNIFCPNIQRKNTLTNSLVTTTTTNLTTSSMIKHQYSISSVHSTKSVKKQSVKASGRRQKRQCGGVGKVNGAFEETGGKTKQHRCHYCSSQVHVNIEDTDYASDEFFSGALNRCEGSSRESCSSGEEIVDIATRSIGSKPVHTIRKTNEQHTINNKRSVSIFNEQDIINKLGLEEDNKIGLQGCNKLGLQGDNKLGLDNDKKLGSQDVKCQVCRMFNKFQTVNNEAVNTAAPINFQFPAKALQYRKAEQAEFIELFKNKAKVDDFDACRMVHTVGIEQSKHLQERLVEPIEIVGNRRALRVDDEKYPKNLHISDNVHSCNQGTGTTGIVDSIDTILVDSEVRNNYTSGNGSKRFWNNSNNEIEPDLIDSETRKTVRHKKFLKRSSTYDLFVGKLLCDARNQTVMKFTNKYVNTMESRQTIGTVATREKCQDQYQKQKLVKHIKALSLENQYNVSDLQENFHQIRNEQVSRHSGYMDRSQSNDQESTPNTFQNATPLKEQFVNRINPREQFMDKTTTKEQVTSSRTHLGIMCNKICSCDSKQTQPIHFCANDFNNYVNFEMIQRECVEKLVDQNKMKTSVSLHTCNRDTRESRLHICRSQESESRNFETRHQYLDRSHWCYKEKYARTSEKQMLDIRDKRGETIATPNRIIFDTTPESLESILDRNIEVLSQQNKSFENTTSDTINHWNKNCDIQRQICQIHQTKHDLEENEYTPIQNNKTDTNHVTRHDNRIKTPPLNKMDEKKRTKRWNNEGEEYYKPSTLHEHNTQSIENIQAQSCFRCSNKKRLLRRKSFDLNTYTGREKQHKNWHEFEYSIQGEKSRDLLARRKSCDFGQMRCAENEKNGQIERKRTKRYWSNESILDKDLCSIFENPMTAHLQLEDTDGLVQDIKDGRFETVNQFEIGRNDNKDLIDLKNKNNLSIKGHTIISMKPALGDEQRSDLLCARRYSMANIIQNQPKTSCLDIDGPNTRDSLTNSTDKLNEYTKHELYHSRSFQLDTKDDQLRVNGRYCAKLQGEQDTAIGIPDNVPQHCIGKYVLKKRRSINF